MSTQVSKVSAILFGAYNGNKVDAVERQVDELLAKENWIVDNDIAQDANGKEMSFNFLGRLEEGALSNKEREELIKRFKAKGWTEVSLHRPACSLSVSSSLGPHVFNWGLALAYSPTAETATV